MTSAAVIPVSTSGRVYKSTTVLAVSVLLTVVGGSIFNVLPLLTAAASQTAHFTERQVGVLSVVICAASGVSALAAGLWVRSVHWARAAAIVLAGMVTANSIGMLIHVYWAFLLLQGTAAFFASAVSCLGMTILSDRPDSARTFGLVIGAQVVYQLVAFTAGPTLLRLAGLNAVLAILTMGAGLALLFASRLPPHGRKIPSGPDAKNLLRPATLIALLAFATFFVNAGAYWTYIELIGQAQGLSPRTVADCVTASVAAGVLGGALAWVLGGRLGKLIALTAAAVVTIGAVLLLRGPLGVAAFVISGVLYVFAWNFSLAYQLALVNAVDASGRSVAVAQAFGFLGSAGGAGLAALYVHPGNYDAVIWLGIVAVCLSTLLFALASALHRHRGSKA